MPIDLGSPLDRALAEAGGVSAPRERAAQLRALLLDELRAGAIELKRTRSGYERPVGVAIAAAAAGLTAVAPVDPALRADPGAVREREWLVVAALVGALVDASAPAVPAAGGAPPTAGGAPPTAGGGPPVEAPALALLTGEFAGWLALALPGPESDAREAAELAAIGFEEQAARIDRLRARAYAVPAIVINGVADLRAPIGEAHPLRAAEAIARLGGEPANERSVAAHEEAVLAMLGSRDGPVRPHEELDPALRVARRIVQRLAGMGKWGGYHTDVAHLQRGFPGHDRALVIEVGARLVESGLLLEKPSVGQRHVFLNPRRAAAIYALIDHGGLPDGLVLP